MISDAHTGLKAAIAPVFEGEGVKRLIQWINRRLNGQRCRVHWMRNALAHVPRGQHTIVAAAIRQAFDQPDRKHAGDTWRHVVEQLRARRPRLTDLMDAREHDVPACIGLRPFLPEAVHRQFAARRADRRELPRQHRTKLHSTNPTERLNKKVKRRADVVGIFPNETSLMRLIGVVLFEQDDEGQTSSRYMMVEAFAQIDEEGIDPILGLTSKTA